MNSEPATTDDIRCSNSGQDAQADECIHMAAVICMLIEEQGRRPELFRLGQSSDRHLDRTLLRRQISDHLVDDSRVE